MKKRILSAILCIAMFAIYMPLALADNSVITITSVGEVTEEATLYLNEIFVNGESDMVYIYSDNAAIQRYNAEQFQTSLQDTPFSPLLSEIAEAIPNDEPRKYGWAYSSAHQDEMDENWKSASYVASKYYGGYAKTKQSVNAYDKYASFKAYWDAEEFNSDISKRITNENYDASKKDILQQGFYHD